MDAPPRLPLNRSKADLILIFAKREGCIPQDKMVQLFSHKNAADVR